VEEEEAGGKEDCSIDPTVGGGVDAVAGTGGRDRVVDGGGGGRLPGHN
jgi:hypothetical protein